MNRASRLLVATLSGWGIALAAASPGWAEPADPSAEQDILPAAAIPETDWGAVGVASAPTTGDPVAQACDQFDGAISLAAVNYEEFAYATAGSGNYVDYQDPNIQRTNIIGRTALREAAAAALGASRLPGLPPEVSDPMRAWSLHATKLLLVMGLRGGGDTLNSSAEQLNADATEVQFACAAARG